MFDFGVQSTGRSEFGPVALHKLDENLERSLGLSWVTSIALGILNIQKHFNENSRTETQLR